MRIPEPFQSELNYSRKLFEAGLDAVQHDASDQSLKSEFSRAVRSAWVPALFGTAVGLFAVLAAGGSKRGRNAVFGALAGGAVGFSGGVAWATRNASSKIVRHAGESLGAVRDQHWLEKNPVAYG